MFLPKDIHFLKPKNVKLLRMGDFLIISINIIVRVGICTSIGDEHLMIIIAVR